MRTSDYSQPATRTERGPLSAEKRALLDRLIRAGGYADREIAYKVGCSSKTVARHRWARQKEAA